MKNMKSYYEEVITIIEVIIIIIKKRLKIYEKDAYEINAKCMTHPTEIWITNQGANIDNRIILKTIMSTKIYFNLKLLNLLSVK